MKTPPWVRLYQDRYLSSARIASITTMQEGVYIRLLMIQAAGGRTGLPGGDWRACLPLTKRCAPEEDVKFVVEEFFPEDDDGRRRSPLSWPNGAAIRFGCISPKWPRSPCSPARRKSRWPKKSR